MSFHMINNRGAQKMYTHVNIQNICLNNLSVYLQLYFANVCMWSVLQKLSKDIFKVELKIHQ